MDEWMDGIINGKIDGQMNRQAIDNGWMDG
jgi:hypothetical protein